MRNSAARCHEIEWPAATLNRMLILAAVWRALRPSGDELAVSFWVYVPLEMGFPALPYDQGDKTSVRAYGRPSAPMSENPMQSSDGHDQQDQQRPHIDRQINKLGHNLGYCLM